MRSWLMTHGSPFLPFPIYSFLSFGAFMKINWRCTYYNNLALYIVNMPDIDNIAKTVYNINIIHIRSQRCTYVVMCDRCWYNFTHSLFSWCGLTWSLNIPFYVIHAKMTFIPLYGLLSMPLLIQRGSREYNTVLCICLRVWEATVVLSCRCPYISHTSYIRSFTCFVYMALSPDMEGIEKNSSSSHAQKLGCMQTWELYKCTYMQPRAKPAIVTGECVSIVFACVWSVWIQVWKFSCQ